MNGAGFLFCGREPRKRAHEWPSAVRDAVVSAAAKTTAMLALCLTILSGCSPTESIAPIGAQSTFIGEAFVIEGDQTIASDVRVAVVIEDRSIIAYLCGGAATYGEHSRWFVGSLDRDLRDGGDGPSLDGTVSLTAKDGSSMQLAISNGQVNGTAIEPNGETLSIEADLIERATDALHDMDGPIEVGLYSVVDHGCRTGVIVYNDGNNDELRVQGTWCGSADAMNSKESIYAQVTPILPILAGPDGVRVRVLGSAADMPELDTRELVAMPISPRDFGPPTPRPR